MLKKSRIDYKWIILAISFLMEFIALGFCSSNMGLFTVPVTDALGIDRLAYSLSISIRYGIQVIVALFYGSLMNRFGAWKLVCAGLASILICLIIRILGTNVYHFYIAGALMGLGIVFTGNSMAATIVRRWFKADIGKYTGIVMSANGIGSAVSAQILSPLINNGEAFGYRKAYLLCAVIHLVISLIILIFLRETPNGGPVVAEQQQGAPNKGVMWSGITFSVLKKKAYFYVAVALVFFTGNSMQSISNVNIVYMTDLGISPAFIATIATVGSLMLTFSKITAGVAYDKLGLRKVLTLCLTAGVIGFALKGLLTNSTLGKTMAITSEVLVYLAMPLQTVMLPLLCNDLFGSISFNQTLGVFLSANSLGLCLGTPMGELIRKLTGDYRICFWIFTIALALTVIAYQFVLNTANKEKAAVLAAK